MRYSLHFFLLIFFSSCFQSTTIKLDFNDIHNKLYTYNPKPNTFKVAIEIKKSDTGTSDFEIGSDHKSSFIIQLNGRVDSTYTGDWYENEFGIVLKTQTKNPIGKVKLIFYE